MSIVREVEPADHEAVAALRRGEGWDVLTPEDWQHLRERNPARGRNGRRLSPGWVLEDEGRIVGSVSNHAQAFRLGDRTLLAASAGDLVVLPDFRGKSMQLVLPFVRQPGVDLLLNTTCSPEASQIFQFLKFQRLPQSDYDRNDYWVLREARFLNAGLRKKGFPGALSRPAGVLLAPLLWSEIRVRGRRPRSVGPSPETRAVEVGAVGDDFDDLWRRKLAESRKLLACRDAATLRWHFARRGRPDPPFLVGAYVGTKLVGFAAVTLRDNPRFPLRRATIADLFVERDEPRIIRQLLAAAFRHARDRGADILQSVGFPESARRVIRESRPLTLTDRAWPYLYRANDPDLHRELGSAALWHACLYDGDGSL